jgi:alpha-tubulin suppressor-like RCC1 family protein
VQPTASESGGVIAPAVQVAFRDASGKTVTSATGAITLGLGANPNGAALGGTVTQNATAGVATFSNLTISKTGSGYTLTASSPSVTMATSSAFNVVAHGAGGAGYSIIVAGGERDTSGHSCGISGGAAWCWGLNDHGQLGDASTTDRNSPVKVGTTQTFTTLAAGGHHTCGLTAAGAAYCWGWDEYGQLGDSAKGLTADKNSPVAVRGGHTFTAITAGLHFTCALDNTGKAWCWGYNGDGEAGTGDTTHNVVVPAAVTGGNTYGKIASGGAHTCALDNTNVAWCWGYNGNGELGEGVSVPKCDTTPVAAACRSFVPIQVNTTVTFTAISSGNYHTCALSGAGASWCWGWNAEGEVGNGIAHYVTVPTATVGNLTFASINAGGMHTCGITPDGHAYCWGWNAYGGLGTGTQNDSRVPAAIQQTGWAQIAGGGGHSCGTDAASHKAFCWGENANGEVGDGSNTFRLTPTLVAGQ